MVSEMYEELYNTKWIWWIPIISVFYFGEIAEWMLDTKTPEQSQNRRDVFFWFIGPTNFIYFILLIKLFI